MILWYPHHSRDSIPAPLRIKFQFRNLIMQPVPTTLWSSLQKGKEQEYKLGKWLKKRYDDILNSSLSSSGYKWDIIKVNSSDKDRTLMSAELVLAGMFPPKKLELWTEEDINWQPIPVHTVPTPYDNVRFCIFKNLIRARKGVQLLGVRDFQM